MAKQLITPAAVLCAVAAVFSFLVPTIVSAARVSPARYMVQGRVFCDTCGVGFETHTSTNLVGAKVRMDCLSSSSPQELCSYVGETDATGTYYISITKEHEHASCEVVLISSPNSECARIVEGHERARVFLNSDGRGTRFADSFGFQKDTLSSVCDQSFKQFV